jgi:hypothetical protein
MRDGCSHVANTFSSPSARGRTAKLACCVPRTTLFRFEKGFSDDSIEYVTTLPSARPTKRVAGCSENNFATMSDRGTATLPSSATLSVALVLSVCRSRTSTLLPSQNPTTHACGNEGDMKMQETCSLFENSRRACSCMLDPERSSKTNVAPCRDSRTKSAPTETAVMGEGACHVFNTISPSASVKRTVELVT